jgi:hypothetical protein
MASKQRKAANDFTTTFPPATIRKWKRMVRRWEANSSKPNPYVSNDRGMFFFAPRQVSQLTVVPSASKVSEIRLRLAQEEAAEVERGQRAPHQVSASVFIRMGLELEEQQ